MAKNLSISRRILRHVSFVLLALFGGVIGAAQPVDRPAPSDNGGAIGGPGMSGVALNAGIQVQTTPLNIERPSGNRPSQPIPQNLTGIGGGFVPPFDGDLRSRFGERRISNILLELRSGALAGFGSPVLLENPGQAVDLSAAPWRPADTPAAIPPAPAALANIAGLISAPNPAAYDALWADYQVAVNVAAQAYGAAASVNDYAFAVSAAARPGDHYAAYAGTYAAYCAAFPWDCYSYAYSHLMQRYEYTGTISSEPLAEAALSVSATTAAYSTQSPAPSAEAYEALVLFASDQLGAPVQPLYAGAATADTAALLQALPAEMQAFFAQAADLSGAAYWGLLNGGAAGVATASAENLSAELSSASAGIYALLTSDAAPTTDNAALALITQVYPKLNGLAFAKISNIQGFAYTATAAGLGLDPATRQPLSAVKVIYVGVVNAAGQTLVYALVGVGEAYAGIMTG